MVGSRLIKGSYQVPSMSRPPAAGPGSRGAVTTARSASCGDLLPLPPRRVSSGSHGSRVISRGLLAGDAKAPAVQYLRRNPDEVLPHPQGPGAEAHLAQLGDVGGIGHFPRLPDGGDAPPGPLV